MSKGNLLINWYDRITNNVRSDIELYLAEATSCKPPVLELAAGTGRILIELLKNGIETHGLDLSEEMLEICKSKLQKQGLETKIYNMNMAHFQLPEKNYGMIFCSRASLQMLQARDELLACLSNIYEHLDKAGIFVTDLFVPWQGIIENNQNQWIISPAVKDGNEQLICQSSNSYDLEEQTQHIIYKYELYRDSFLAETMIEEYLLRWYGREEFRLILEKVGFCNIEIFKSNIFQNYDHGYAIRAHKE